MVAVKCISKIKIDIPKNRLLLQFSGKIDKKQLNSLYTDIRFSVADLKPGFHVISDLTNCKIANLNTLPTLCNIMNFLIESKVGEVIRITHRKSVMHRQILNFSARRQGYKPIYVSTFEEAEEYLENSEREARTRIGLQNLKVNYMTGEAEGVGTLHELSTDCCAIKVENIAPSVNEQLSIQFELLQKKDTPRKFAMQAQVTGVIDKIITCEFTDLPEDIKKELWNCLVFEAKRDIK